MTINFDPRAMEAKRQRAAELERQAQLHIRKGLHPTDFALLVGAVFMVSLVVAAIIATNPF